MLFILVNRYPIRYFAYKCGVQQGVPLSPLSFSLAKDVLSMSITLLVYSWTLKRMVGPWKFITPSHILYEDIIMVLFKGTQCNLEFLT